MTIQQLLTQLRAQMQDAARSGTAGAKALGQASQTLDALADEVGLLEQRSADRIGRRYGAMLRLACATPEEFYALEQRAQERYPELWEGVFVGTGQMEKEGANG